MRSLAKQLMRLDTLLALLVWVGLAGVAVGPARADEARKYVDEGIAQFREGDYAAAERAFRAADVARPENDRVALDMACALAAQGSLDEAVELLRTTAMSRDAALSATAHYNLGGIAAERAKRLFGEKPEDATPEVRTEGLSHLLTAVVHYRDCLELEPHHEGARHNLELLRLWIKTMQAIWEDRDRQQQRDQMDLLQFLEMLDREQRQLRKTTQGFGDRPRSPKRRQEMSVTEHEQSLLSAEMDPLKEKIRQSLEQPAQPGAAAPPVPDERMQEAVEMLSELADEAGSAMLAAADHMGDGQPNEAVRDQAEAVEQLDQIRTGVVPFQDLLERALASQQRLVNEEEEEKEGDEDGAADEQPDDSATEEPASEAANLAEAAWDQDFVARWSQLLAPKAKYEKEQLQQTPAATAQDPNAPPGASPPADPQAGAEDREALEKALDKAIELGPAIAERTASATEHLKNGDPDAARPDQERAIELLQEIADELPKQNQQGQDQNQQQQQDQQDQQQQDSGQDQNQDQPQEQEQNQDQSSEEDRQPQTSPQQEPSQQQAEATLRRARERERQRRELEEQLERALHRRLPVERDW